MQHSERLERPERSRENSLDTPRKSRYDDSSDRRRRELSRFDDRRRRSRHSNDRHRGRNEDRDYRDRWIRSRSKEIPPRTTDQPGLLKSERHREISPRNSSRSKSPEIEKPNYESGVLARPINKIIDKTHPPTYNEPTDTTNPPQANPFHLYLFEPGDENPTKKIKLDQRSFYRLGRDSSLSEIQLQDSSCSRLHAVLQFRRIEKTNEFGETNFETNLYILDLDSTNCTYLNDTVVPSGRYVQVLSQDVLSFGDISTDFVVVRCA